MTRNISILPNNDRFLFLKLINYWIEVNSRSIRFDGARDEVSFLKK